MSRAHDWHATKKQEITCKFRLEDPKFDGYPARNLVNG